VIGQSTGSTVDAVLHDCLVVILDSDLEPTWNYVDHLARKFPILKPISPCALPSTLTAIFGVERKKREQEFVRIQQELLAGLEEVSDTNLESFR
jgi:hypothetical protein